MNNKIVEGNYRVAIVRHENSSKEYSFAMFSDVCAFPEDYVLVDTVQGAAVGQIVDIVDKMQAPELPTREVICLLDFKPFQERAKLRAEAKRIRGKMLQVTTQFQEMALFETLAERSPELRELLDAYKNLTSQLS